MHDPAGRTDRDGFGAVSEHSGSTGRTTMWPSQDVNLNGNAMAARMLTVDNIAELALTGPFPQTVFCQRLVIFDSIWRGVCDTRKCQDY